MVNRIASFKKIMSHSDNLKTYNYRPPHTALTSRWMAVPGRARTAGRDPHAQRSQPTTSWSRRFLRPWPLCPPSLACPFATAPLDPGVSGPTPGTVDLRMMKKPEMLPLNRKDGK